MEMQTAPSLPVAVIGAGPVGLAAAAHLAERNLPFVVLEAGPAAGDHVRAWGHVRVFSPWRFNVDPAAVRMLEASGWTAPDPEELPTGAEIVERYLAPLAALPSIAPHVRYGARVTAVRRRGLDKLKTAGRAEAPFALRYTTAAGEQELLAGAGVDDQLPTRASIGARAHALVAQGVVRLETGFATASLLRVPEGIVLSDR